MTLRPHEETPLFDPRMEQDIEQTWEALNRYDRYHTDRLILYARSDIEGYDARLEDEVRRKWYNNNLEPDMQRIDNMLRALVLLEMRYQELNPQDPDNSHKYSLHNGGSLRAHQKMLARVMQEWETRYLDLRIEEVPASDYDEWASARKQYAGVDETQHSRNHAYHYALASVELVPLYGNEALHLIVPPNVQVTGDLGDTTIYLWSEVDNPLQGATTYNGANHARPQIPKTRALLSQYAGYPVGITMRALEDMFEQSSLQPQPD